MCKCRDTSETLHSTDWQAVCRCLRLSNKYTPGRQRTIVGLRFSFYDILCFNIVKWKTEFCERAFPIHKRVVKQTRRLRIKPAALIYFTSRFPLDHVPMVRLSKIHTRANPRRSRRSKKEIGVTARHGKAGTLGHRQVDNRLRTAFCARTFIERPLPSKRNISFSPFPIRYRDISLENSVYRWWTCEAYSLWRKNENFCLFRYKSTWPFGALYDPFSFLCTPGWESERASKRMNDRARGVVIGEKLR